MMMPKRILTPQEYREAWRKERSDIPYGLCFCGCGNPTNLAKSNHAKHSWVKGEPLRYLRGHRRNYRFQTVFPGDRHHMLLVLEYLRTERHASARVLCDCGNEAVIRIDHLLSKKNPIRSCGCHRSRVTAARNKARTKHGHCVEGQGESNRSGAYISWTALNVRCGDYTGTGREHYADRPEEHGGPVKVCERIRFASQDGSEDAFENFLALLGPRPEGHEIDRIDGLYHYSCGSCPECLANGWDMNMRWVTHETNIQNRRPSSPRKSTASAA